MQKYQGTGRSMLPFQEGLDFPGASQDILHYSTTCVQTPGRILDVRCQQGHMVEWFKHR